MLTQSQIQSWTEIANYIKEGIEKTNQKTGLKFELHSSIEDLAYGRGIKVLEHTKQKCLEFDFPRDVYTFLRGVRYTSKEVK